MRIKVLFLYTELAGYFLNCLMCLRREIQGEIKIIHWPNSSVAPFDYKLEGIEMKLKTAFKGQELFAEAVAFAPALVFVAGWVDNDYKRIAKTLKKNGSVVVCGLDNPWKGTFYQRLLCMLSPILIRPYFQYWWVAGYRQYQFASRLGYSNQSIITGLYAADIDQLIQEQKSVYKPYLLFVGRLEEIKGIKFLCQVFSALSEEERNGWTLRCIGNGPLKTKIQIFPHVIVEDFMQPHNLFQNTCDAGGFILPSFEEHWGVVVQEFAASGLPLILSDAVNAGEKYLIHGYNGFKFKNRNKNDLKKVLVHYFREKPEQIREMGKRSVELASTYSPSMWVTKFLSFLKLAS